MPRSKASDLDYDISFYEAVLRRDPGYALVVELLGGLYTRRGRIADGLRMDRRLVRLQPANATARYNLACSLALSRRRGEALRALRQAVELGYDDANWMEQDPDLATLRNHPGYVGLLSSLKPQS
jgi:Flp pilus assembly protein TadD